MRGGAVWGARDDVVRVRATQEDGGHSHGVSDPGHGHGINDPGHNHNDGSFDRLLQVTGVDTATDHDGLGGGEPDIRRTGTLQSRPTGITIQSHATGVGVNANTAGVTASLRSADTETRPRSTAMLACIKH